MLKAGTILEGRYEVIRPVGRGGMGNVYQVRHQAFGDSLALKEVNLKVDEDLRDHIVRQFRLEAKVLRQLSHPGLPRVHDYFEARDHCYLVMDFVDGKTLEQRQAAAGRLAEADVLAYARQITEVLCYLHSQTPSVIFRDLKPSNIMVDHNGGVKLIDFGIAKRLDPETGAGTSTLAHNCGSPAFAAPEQYGSQSDGRTDIYSFGATLYVLLSGSLPPQSVLVATGLIGVTPLQGISPFMAGLVAWMMQPGPHSRPQSILDVRAALSTLTLPAGAQAVWSVAHEEGANSLPKRPADVIYAPTHRADEPGAPVIGDGPVSPGAPPVAAARVAAPPTHPAPVSSLLSAPPTHPVLPAMEVRPVPLPSTHLAATPESGRAPLASPVVGPSIPGPPPTHLRPVALPLTSLKRPPSSRRMGIGGYTALIVALGVAVGGYLVRTAPAEPPTASASPSTGATVVMAPPLSPPPASPAPAAIPVQPVAVASTWPAPSSRLRLVVTPASAQVFFNGEAQSRAPDGYTVPGFPIQIKLRNAGFCPLDTTLASMPPGNRMEYRLVPFASLLVRSQTAGTVRVDSIATSPSTPLHRLLPMPGSLTLPPGQYRILFSAPGYFDRRVVAVLRPGERHAMTIELAAVPRPAPAVQPPLYRPAPPAPRPPRPVAPHSIE